MSETSIEEPGRLLERSGLPVLLRGGLGRAVLRPPFDWLAVRAVSRVYLRASRAWASALDCGEDLDRFLAETGIRRTTAALKRAVATAQTRKADYDSQRALWERILFAGTGELGAEPEPADLALQEHRRQSAAHAMMSARAGFLPYRRQLKPAAWEVAAEAEVERQHGGRLADLGGAFPLPAQPEVEVSRPAPGRFGPERWLRFQSPVLGDHSWAHVFDLDDRPNAPTAIFLHGIAMETEMWRGAPNVAPVLAELGFRSILAEGPWHGARRPAGRYGGEPILARGPLGLIELLQAWVAEVAVLIRWARQTSSGPVVLTGVSLGALASQRAASAATRWAAEARPDALMLVATSGTLIDLAGTGSLARQTGLEREIRAAGWSDRDLTRWLPLMEPEPEPPLPPDHILMVLGASDDLTPFRGGHALAEAWKVPPENLFLRPQGHFSVSLGVLAEPEPLDRLKAVVERL